MKAKLIAFAVGLLAAATIGVVQLQADAAQPGQVGNSPRCSVNAVGARGSAYAISGGKATVKFRVTGQKNCRVQVSSNMFYAPTMNGKPYSKQILFERKTRVVTPGVYTMSNNIPAKSTPAKGCYYQVDLTYGTHNITPVIAYGHGKLDCSVPKPPQPSAACNALTVNRLSDTSFRFDATASVKNGAKVRGYTFTVVKDGQTINTKTIASSQLAASYPYTAPGDGSYSVRVQVATSTGTKTGPNCVKSFTVDTKKPTPSVDINKLVEGVDYMKVGVNVEYNYQIAVKNTGEVNLTNVVVTDTPEAGVTLLSASAGNISGNKWTHTIPALAIGETMNFTIKAKVPEYQAGRITNTVCVDAPQVPGSPDDCDDADVEVPPEPGKVTVCNPETGKIITVDQSEASKYVPVNSPECEKETPEKPSEPTPEALPQTGPAETIMQLIGIGSLVSAGSYYLMSSRRNG